ncbi:MAG: hypothetical protein ABI972_22775 [Acidobacteriota bacterium]
MPTRDVTITISPADSLVSANPFQIPIHDGDTVNIRHSGPEALEVVFSSDTIGRLSPQPDQVVQLGVGETITFNVENAQAKVYLVQVRPVNRRVSVPGTTVGTNSGGAVMMFLPYSSFQTAATIGGLEEFP